MRERTLAGASNASSFPVEVRSICNNSLRVSFCRTCVCVCVCVHTYVHRYARAEKASSTHTFHATFHSG